MAVTLIFLAWLVSCEGQFVDELQGYDRSCLSEDTFRCLNGICISQEQYCDGTKDCPDGSDEEYCHIALDPKECDPTSHFLCDDRKKCIPNMSICNKMFDCDDKSDEVNCTTTVKRSNSTTCKGFLCDKTKCISNLWTCDGVIHCKDKTDESQETCKEDNEERLKYIDLNQCLVRRLADRLPFYRCLDSSFCVPAHMMCDGLADCYDESDEGDFCKSWKSRCTNNPCIGKGVSCISERGGVSCNCYESGLEYDNTTHTCEDFDECQTARPSCSQLCFNEPSTFSCGCERGYKVSNIPAKCTATGPEALLFYSTHSEIKYVKLKSNVTVTLATGIKKAHGVAYDGKYLYWVETAEEHGAIMRAQMDNLKETREVLVSLGLEDPGDVAVDWLGGHIYFSDAERGTISVCLSDGSICTILPVKAKNPKFVTLDVKNGKMYWADFFDRPVIMGAQMDGTDAYILVDKLSTFATGLAVDVPSGRLYYVDKHINVVKIDTKKVFPFYEDTIHQPYAVAVFENEVYYSDWKSQTIHIADKLMNVHVRQQIPGVRDAVFDMHIYHPILINKTSNPCTFHKCSHLCLISSNVSSTCACPVGMELHNDISCTHIDGFRPQYLIVGAGADFTRIQYNSFGNLETEATHLEIEWGKAMAYDSIRDTLYIYDQRRKVIKNITMEDFTLGITHTIIGDGLEDVVDMDYDYATDTLYVLDAGRQLIEVVSLSNGRRALLYRFQDQEIPVSFSVMTDYGKMLVAVRESEYRKDIHIDSMGLDGSGRKQLVIHNLMGPRVRVRYALDMDLVYIADEGNSVIGYMSPEGKAREQFRALKTTLMGLAVTDTYVFWTDRIEPRLYWANVHDARQTVRGITLSMFSNTTLHIQASSTAPYPHHTLRNHPCTTTADCSYMCVQTPHIQPKKKFQPIQLGFQCLCPSHLLLINGTCKEMKSCKYGMEVYCHRSNECVLKEKKCDGRKDCSLGEDEEGCEAKTTEQPPLERDKCGDYETVCDGRCIEKGVICITDVVDVSVCLQNQFHCVNTTICLERSRMCDGRPDCPDHSDEAPSMCDTWTCMDDEFQCKRGSCIPSIYKCDGEEDCPDDSDENHCATEVCAVGYFQCDITRCVFLTERCDGLRNCNDETDERNCEEIFTEKPKISKCTEDEHECELNKNICLPKTARCNMKPECPGGTDEKDCSRKNDSSYLQPITALPKNTSPICKIGYQCKNGDCVPWHVVCDRTKHCDDGSDENGQCDHACRDIDCEQICNRTPEGSKCACADGYLLANDSLSCVDIDECSDDVCAQHCHNTLGGHLCSCYHGFVISGNRKSCRAATGPALSILYLTGNTVRAVSGDGTTSLQYTDPENATLVDIDVDVRRNKTFVTMPDARKLVELNDGSYHMFTVVTNIGVPTMVSLDWITGNVYFVDNSPISIMRVCHVDNKRCAKLHRLPLVRDAKVTALVVDPSSRRMFYCITNEGESVVWSTTLSGRQLKNLGSFHNCSGLVVDSFKQTLYVAEAWPARISRIHFSGKDRYEMHYGKYHLEAPKGLAIFEDYIYFLVDDSIKINRCRLFSEKSCDIYFQRLSKANAFVMRQISIQREDVSNVCKDFQCSNLCVMDDEGPVCLCNDGTIANDGECSFGLRKDLPIFNGWTYQELSTANHVLYALVGAGILLIITYFCIAILYRRHIKKIRAKIYYEVRYENREAEESPSSSSPAAVGGTWPISSYQNRVAVESPSSSCSPGIRSEPSPVTSTSSVPSLSEILLDPVGLFRNVWYHATRRNRPVGTSRLTIDVPTIRVENEFGDDTEIQSDTESFRDIRKFKQTTVTATTTGTATATTSATVSTTAKNV